MHEQGLSVLVEKPDSGLIRSHAFFEISGDLHSHFLDFLLHRYF